MKTAYIYLLHVVAPDVVAQQLSELVYQLCSDVGSGNVSIPLNSNGDDDLATHYAFSAPVTQQHIEVLLGAGLGVTPGVTWVRTDRDGMLQKRWDDENPTPVRYLFGDLLAERGLKFQFSDNVL